MERASTPTLTSAVEHCWTLVGSRRGRVWCARRIGHQVGTPIRVDFDGPGALRREERRGDVVGFYHTHPEGPLRPSARDLRTMRAWCSAFGKALLCVIASPEGLAGFPFDSAGSGGVPLALVQVFPRGLIIGVEDDGRQVPP